MLPTSLSIFICLPTGARRNDCSIKYHTNYILNYLHSRCVGTRKPRLIHAYINKLFEIAEKVGADDMYKMAMWFNKMALG
jgi:hypothetical protein